MKTKVKICGVTNISDAGSISNLGVDFIGVIYDFDGGRRSINLEEIIKIRKSLKNKRTKLVAVCVNKTIKSLKKIVNYVDVIQLHGEETVEYCKKFRQVYPGKVLWKALRVTSQKDLLEIKKYINVVDKILLDAGNSKDKLKNKNKLLNIKLLKKAEKEYGTKFIIAGGIGFDNIDEIIDKINPKIIDASSKFEINPRKKNVELIKKFLEKI